MTPSTQTLVPVFLRPGPDMQEGKIRMSARTLAAQAGFGTKPGPVPVGGMAGSGVGGPRPGHPERPAFALCANSPDRGAGTWARDVLSPQRRQAGTAGPPLSVLSLVTGQESWKPTYTIGH